MRQWSRVYGSYGLQHVVTFDNSTLVIHRHPEQPHDRWVCSCEDLGLRNVVLVNRDAAKAQIEAVKLMGVHMRTKIRALKEIWHEKVGQDG